MNIEMTNAGNLFDTKSLNKKLTSQKLKISGTSTLRGLKFSRKVKSKSIALVGGVI